MSGRGVFRLFFSTPRPCLEALTPQVASFPRSHIHLVNCVPVELKFVANLCEVFLVWATQLLLEQGVQQCRHILPDPCQQRGDYVNCRSSHSLCQPSGKLCSLKGMNLNKPMKHRIQVIKILGLHSRVQKGIPKLPSRQLPSSFGLTCPSVSE